MIRKVIWEKFSLIKLLENSEDFTDTEDDDSDEEGEEEMMRLGSFRTTQLGAVPDTRTLGLKVYDLWQAHTNFDITSKELTLIKTTPGVEAVQVVSRYRFLLGVGKLFQRADVMSAIAKKLSKGTTPTLDKLRSELVGSYKLDLPKELQQEVEAKCKELEAENSYVAALVLPNASVEYRGTNSLEEFETHALELSTIYQNTGGYLRLN